MPCLSRHLPDVAPHLHHFEDLKVVYVSYYSAEGTSKIQYLSLVKSFIDSDLPPSLEVIHIYIYDHAMGDDRNEAIRKVFNIKFRKLVSALKHKYPAIHEFCLWRPV